MTRLYTKVKMAKRTLATMHHEKIQKVYIYKRAGKLQHFMRETETRYVLTKKRKMNKLICDNCYS